MTDGMKSGAGSDPFADESDPESGKDDSQSEEATAAEPDEPTDGEIEAEARTSSVSEGAETTESVSRRDREGLPYIFRRNGVKDDRKMIQYFLQEDTETLEAEAQGAVEQELDTDVYLTDLREALVRVGAEHIDEVADELREWGYRYQE